MLRKINVSVISLYQYFFFHLRFTSQVSRKLPRNLRTRTNLLDMDMALIVERHAGVLGLCSFVNAYPYDVPEFLPDVILKQFLYLCLLNIDRIGK